MLSPMQQDIHKNKTISGTSVNLMEYTSESNYYTVPNDGIISLMPNASGANTAQLRTITTNGVATLLSVLPNSQVLTINVFKGMKVFVNNVSSIYACQFRELIES